MKRYTLAKVPFGKTIGLSLFLNALHAVLLVTSPTLRFGASLQRPILIKALIVSETFLVMLIFTVAMIHISDEESMEPKGRYYLGIIATVLPWIVILRL